MATKTKTRKPKASLLQSVSDQLHKALAYNATLEEANAQATQDRDAAVKRGDLAEIKLATLREKMGEMTRQDTSLRKIQANIGVLMYSMFGRDERELDKQVEQSLVLPPGTMMLATEDGHYGGIRIRAGTKFILRADMQQGSWMQPIGGLDDLVRERDELRDEVERQAKAIADIASEAKERIGRLRVRSAIQAAV